MILTKYEYTYESSESSVGYFYSGTNVLKNKLGIRNEDALTIAEREITSIKLLMLYNMPITGKFDFIYLCKIHEIIFSDIYEWAGQIRKGDFFSNEIQYFVEGNI